MIDKKIILAELSSEKKASMKEAIKEFATTETHFEFPISDYPEDKFHYWFAVEFLFWVLKKKCVELTPEKLVSNDEFNRFQYLAEKGFKNWSAQELQEFYHIGSKLKAILKKLESLDTEKEEPIEEKSQSVLTDISTEDERLPSEISKDKKEIL